MSTRDDADTTGDDQPVKVQDVLDVPDENTEAPTKPADQPAFPDFNS
ncbi:hypothetical protein [Mycolicibacterium hodleri]|nr:hypothetical protein [Mycolicibacterium hodleri]